MKISVRMEGGLGDHLLANRFIPAIFEKYPKSEIKAWTDTCGKTFQKEVLENFYGHYFQSINVVPRKKYSEFWVNCQFGKDNYYGALENVPDEILQEMKDADIFYDLHVDSLKFTTFDFDWFRYFYFFPRPKLAPDFSGQGLPTDYVAFHLQSATSKGHMLEPWYCERLVKSVAEHVPCVLILLPEQKPFFSSLAGSRNVFFFESDICTVCEVIGRSRAFVSVDSGFRYFAYGAGVPTVTFSKHCVSPGQVLKSHELRWLLYPQQTFPLNYSSSEISRLVLRILENKVCALLPSVKDYKNQLVFRDYSIDFDLTKK